MDVATAGLRLLLRQAALRPLAGPPCRADPRPPARRSRLPGQACALSGKPRRAARRRRIRLAAAPRGSNYHFPVARPALLLSGAVRRRSHSGPNPSLPWPDRADQPGNRRLLRPAIEGDEGYRRLSRRRLVADPAPAGLGR